MINLSLVLPVQNEAEIIKPVYQKILAVLNGLKIRHEVILVENGSTDNSWQKIKKLAENFPETEALWAPKGYGSAVLAGLAKAKGEFVCYMPSDGQIDLTVFPMLWKLAKSRKYKLVKIKRINRESFLRMLISKIFSMIIKVFFNTQFWDVNGSPRIFLRENLLRLNLQCRDSFIDVEFAVKAKKLGWRVKEIPMKTLPRAGGKSTRSLKTFAEFFQNIIYYKIKGFSV